MRANHRVRLIAFYLPQFHPIPENDAWWGKGFTEWTNVAKAEPLFRGHYQPHLPADLGFYDLRVPEVRQAQADLALEYGIYGFCYYHYWFHGKRLLERPFDEVLAFGKPDFPFCLCWANEGWTRSWDGRSEEYLIKQEYSEADDQHHIQWLCGVFQDKRYIRINGRPLFLVYRASQLPDPLKTISFWREEACRLGIGELYLCRVESFLNERGDPKKLGFDAAVEFQPDWAALARPKRRGGSWGLATRIGLSSSAYQMNRIFRYGTQVEKALAKLPASYVRYRCVNPSWDNSPRRQTDAVILHGSSPSLYEKWLKMIVERLDNTKEDNLVFINAWNEWAEGNHLEPDLHFGCAYLESTRRALFPE